MKKIGRNDACPCGSGKKYKLCCLDKDQANKVTRITPSQVEEPLSAWTDKLPWSQEQYRDIALQLGQTMSDRYTRQEIEETVTLWNAYTAIQQPTVRKPGTYCAAMEYCYAQLQGKSEVTKSQLAELYDVAESTITKNAKALMEVVEPMHRERAVQASASPAAVAAADHRVSAKRKEVAAELIKQAWNQTTARKKAQLAAQAVDLDPNNPEAYALLAENAAKTVEEAAEFYKQGMLAGERELGKAFFEEHKGVFWLAHETRPYMRAKQGYAEALRLAGRANEAITQCAQMLELNPNDNQGIRYLLLTCYLDIQDWKRASKLIEAYDESGTSFNYNRLLVEFGQKGITSKLSSLLKEAHRQNPHVSGYLTGSKPVPSETPDATGFGDEREAAFYAQSHFELWQRQPKLLRWLEEELRHGQ
ncbi:SEC-C metal-binding domain-containing protein [Paenibacillus cremeus]|uniref:Tetratricopeptide repeat protein n=1 Tax=Paenibacillus cremeus TaxID=2163881 RepID=A0A559JPV3_9BACL|nr:SEC-C metal-binding domain-containing protein [Paenibacillus cremeus]TVY01901.1 hypothetical protein FPZ49_31850 [Paenibacillus cremeus]